MIVRNASALVRPRPWSTGDAGSFAHQTLAVRVPQILKDTVEANARGNWPFPDDVLRACDDLYDELVRGKLRLLREDASDRSAWDAAAAPWVGKSWLELPWYFAESFFYRRLLEATGYFGARAGLDPFLVVKEEEEKRMLPRIQDARARRPSRSELLYLSLWGNRVDLSYSAGRAFGDAGADADVLVDDSVAALALLETAPSVGILLDNAGTELAFDLLLAAALADAGLAITLFAKPHPFFVSDATDRDVERTARLLGLRPQEVVVHPFLTSSHFLLTDELTAHAPDLSARLSACSLVISKGDANYRRLVGDAAWRHDTSVIDAMDFPAPLLALRTCKAEVAVGLSHDVVARAQARDPRWLVSGRFGMIQLAANRHAAAAR